MATEPTVAVNHTRKAWQLVLFAVPALLGSLGSYLKSRAEATDQSIAAYKTCTEGLLHLQEDFKSNRDEILMLKGRMLACENGRVNQDGVGEISSDESFSVRPTPVAPVPFFVDAGTDASLLLFVDSGAIDSGLAPAAPKALLGPTQDFPHQALDLPVNLDEAVERYKSKK